MPKLRIFQQFLRFCSFCCCCCYFFVFRRQLTLAGIVKCFTAVLLQYTDILLYLRCFAYPPPCSQICIYKSQEKKRMKKRKRKKKEKDLYIRHNNRRVIVLHCFMYVSARATYIYCLQLLMPPSTCIMYTNQTINILYYIEYSIVEHTREYRHMPDHPLR